MKTKGKKAGIKIMPLVADKTPAATQNFSKTLAELKAIAKPGNMDALGAAWKEIGAEARKALAAELPALKAACAEPADDVPFDDKPTLADQLADTPAEAKAKEIKAKLEAAADAETVEALIADAETHRDAFDDATLTSLEIAYSKARGRFAQVQGELA
jgi:hypothetical protein